MRLDRVEALEIEQRIDVAVRGRIAVDGRHDIGAERIAERRVVLQRVGIGLADQFARHVRMVEPLGDAMHHRLLETVVMQDRRIDEARKLGSRRTASSASSRIRVQTGSTLSSLCADLSCWAMVPPP